MRKWGIVISLFYVAILFALLIPAGILMAGDIDPLWKIYSNVLTLNGQWVSWVVIVAVIAGQAILLFLSVDTSFRKLKPRAHVAVTVIVTSMFFALLLFAAISCLADAFSWDTFIDRVWSSAAPALCFWVAIWAVWGVAFYFYARGSMEELRELSRGCSKGACWSC